MGEKPFLGSVDKVSLVKSCNFQESWKAFTCRELGKDFLVLSGHLQQQATHSREKPKKISECGVTCRRRKIHYTRGECKKAFNPQNTLDQDQGVHTGRQCFVCQDCGKAFRFKCLYVVHQKVHTIEGLYMCGECGKSFKWSSTLSQHERVHTGARQYKYSKCGKSFSCKSLLVYPKKGHIGEK